MGKFPGRNEGIPRVKKWSKIFGFMIFLGAFISLIAILEAIKVTEYATYKNTEHRFQMKYPTYWSIMPRPKEGALVIYRAPQRTTMDSFIPNVNVTKQQLTENKMFNFEVFSKEAVRQIAGLFEKLLLVVESRPIVAAGRRAYRFIYTGNVDPKEDPIYYMHVWFFVGNDAYIITYSARKSDFKRYLRTVNTMINSFSTF